MLYANEPGTKPRPGVLLGGEPGSYTDFQQQSQVLAHRYGVSTAVAEVILGHIRGGRQ